MNTLFAYVTKNKEFSKVINCDDLYTKPENITPKEFNPRSALTNETDWFVISNFSKTPYTLVFFSKIDTTFPQLDLSSLKSLRDISYLCWVKENGDKTRDFYFQKTIPTKCITQTKNELFFSDKPNIKKVSPHITIENEPDAFYLSKEDKLYFKKLERISTIFKNINELSKEATAAEIDAFKNSKRYSFGFTLNTKDITKRMSRQIKKADAFLDSLKQSQKTAFNDYCKDFCSGVTINKNGKYTFPTLNDMKRFLDATEENFYLTPVTQDPRIVDTIIDPKDY